MLVAALVAQMVGAVLMRQHPSLATAQAVASLVLALGVAALSRWVENIAYAAAYVTGAEVLWRVTEARVFHEVGKYALIMILGVGLLRMGGRERMALPLAYLAVLLPSAVLTLDHYGLAGSREELSFNLSGPAALAVSVLFFSRFRAGWPTVIRLLWAMVVPIAGIAAVAAFSTASARDLVFSGSSNFVTSGGFGPNQVSAVLGLGALLALVLAVGEQALDRRLLALALAVWMLVQSVLTFSRGGLLNVVIALLLAGVYSLREPRRVAGLIVPVLAVTVFSGLVVYPRMVQLTNGVLETRFTDFTLDERGALVRQDLRAFREHPLFGVGPGVGKVYRQLPDGRTVSAHTEFTRLLAEHGVGGIVAIGLLLAMVLAAYRRAGRRLTKAWVLVLASWALSEMTHGGMRVAAISLAVGLMMIEIVGERQPVGRAACP